MFEANTKKWEATVFERGIEKGIEKNQFEIAEKMILNGMSTTDIRKITGLSIGKIQQVRRKCKR